MSTGYKEARNSTRQLTDSTKLSVPGWDRTYNVLVSILLSQRISPLCQLGMMISIILQDLYLQSK